MTPPRDSDDDPEEIFHPIEDAEYVMDENAEVITLDENDEDPGLQEGVEDLDFSDIPENDEEENGYIPDNSKMAFTQHEGSIFSVRISPNDKNLAVTGGEDDKGFVWKINSGEVQFECPGHKDSVTSCGFSADGKYVMTADMGGTIIVRDTDGKTAWDFECSDIEWCFWHSAINVLFAGTTDGDIYMWKIPSGDCKIFQGHGSKSLTGCLLTSGKELLAGYEDGSLKLWDLKTATCIFHHQSDGDAIICVDNQNNGNLVACGTQNGSVKVLNFPAGKLVVTFDASSASKQNDEKHEIDSTESISFSPSEQYIASGSLDGRLLIWDLSTQRLRHECKHPAGLSHVVWHQSDQKVIITACLDGVLREWDSRTGELIKELQGHRGNILDVVLSNDGKVILTAGDDHTARVFDK